MRRREFIAGLGVAVAWLGGARAQQSDQMRRIAYLTASAESDPEAQQWAAAFRKGLEEHGWIEGRNVRIDYRFGGGDSSAMPSLAKELLEHRPDVILAATGPAVTASRQQTLSIPIVFVCPPPSMGLRSRELAAPKPAVPLEQEDATERFYRSHFRKTPSQGIRRPRLRIQFPRHIIASLER